MSRADGFPGGSDCEESTCNVRDLGLIPGLGRSPGGGHGNPLQYSCLENPHGLRSLLGHMGSQRVGHNLTYSSICEKDFLRSYIQNEAFLIIQVREVPSASSWKYLLYLPDTYCHLNATDLLVYMFIVFHCASLPAQAP